MEHYQEQFKCSKCKRWLIVDIMSYGSGHQSILGVTCKKCATRIMKKGEIEKPKTKLTKYGKELMKKGIIDKNGNPTSNATIQKAKIKSITTSSKKN